MFASEPTLEHSWMSLMIHMTAKMTHASALDVGIGQVSAFTCVEYCFRRGGAEIAWASVAAISALKRIQHTETSGPAHKLSPSDFATKNRTHRAAFGARALVVFIMRHWSFLPVNNDVLIVVLRAGIPGGVHANKGENLVRSFCGGEIATKSVSTLWRHCRSQRMSTKDREC